MRGVEPATALRCTTTCGSSRAACSSRRSGEAVVGRGVAGRYRGAQLGDELEFGRGRWKVVGRPRVGRLVVRERGLGRRARARERRQAHPALLGLPAARRRRRRRRGARAPHRRRPALRARGAARDRVLRRSRPSRRTRSTCWSSASRCWPASAPAFGATNTMYAAVQARTAEIGTLRAIGFSRASILRSFLVESLVTAAARLRGRRRARRWRSAPRSRCALGGIGFGAATFTTNVIAAARRRPRDLVAALGLALVDRACRRPRPGAGAPRAPPGRSAAEGLS